ncbi:MAG TPA: ParB/RepB/Spo0J family partition protein [Azospirillaceae bacterium]|nr:ParB/RepB/Spo0J family partition protein [Azospirillaceae bacterium]
MRNWKKGTGGAAIGRDIERTAKAALFGEDDGLEMLELPLDAVEPNPDQPRRHFDADDLAALAQSIRQVGQLQPIGVTRIPGSRPWRYRIAFGERRWRAVPMAGLERIRAVVLPDGADAGLVAVIENLQRSDLRPVEEAQAFRRLMETHGFSQERLGEAIGRSLTQVNQTLALLRLHPDIQEALQAGGAEVPRSVLLELARMDDAEGQLALWHQARGGGLTAVEARAARRGAPAPAPVTGTARARPGRSALVAGARSLAKALDASGGALAPEEREALADLQERLAALLGR